MPPRNLLIILSDEHNKKMLGCYGHPVVRTPNLDALAARGTRFTDAYTCSPVCVPARAAFATGRYLHEVGRFWDNADPYDGSVRSWHHAVRDAGLDVVSIGKLHFRSTADDNGFSEEIIPMNVIDGEGDLMGLVREDLPERGGAWKMAKLAGPGESPYTFYDRDITSRAQVWLEERAASGKDAPFVLFVSLVCPHFPLTAPPEYFYPYWRDPRVGLPKAYLPEERPDHPFLKDYAGSFVYDAHFRDHDHVRRAVAGYYGLCSFLDEQVGKIVGALERSGLGATTRVLYTSDHGDNLGARGLWGKSTMYEEAAAVPAILAGPEVPPGAVCDTPSAQVDIFPLVTGTVGIDAGYEGPGVSLVDLANGARPERTILSEYHGMGSTTGAFMIRNGSYKYIEYAASNYPPQLFDLAADPEEMTDLAGDPAHAGTLADCRARLRTLCDPAQVDARAKARQAERLAAAGGRDAVIARGDLGFSPPPGMAAAFD